jgi:hypothetical protein
MYGVPWHFWQAATLAVEAYAVALVLPASP